MDQGSLLKFNRCLPGPIQHKAMSCFREENGRVNTPIFQAERSHKNQWREFVSWYVSIV